MLEENKKTNHLPTQTKLRSPRAAAMAGILFAVLSSTSLILIRLSFPDNMLDPGDWLADEAENLSLAMNLVPFAGIFFLWFMGVVRERMGHQEEQFFSTLFFGSGYLYLGMSFVAAALAGSVLVLYAVEPELVVNSGVSLLAITLSNMLNSVYAMRMAGVFMFVLGTIWWRTRVMPRWLAVVTYALAVVLLISISFTLWVILIFPAWVFGISIAILILNHRLTPDQKGEDA